MRKETMYVEADQYAQKDQLILARMINEAKGDAAIFQDLHKQRFAYHASLVTASRITGSRSGYEAVGE